MSDEDENDYIQFGKPLKELTEGENIRKRPISVEEQIVTDRNGKRRFHGAFTGGFSAGFFNTVDTPQGWTPSQFKSSRGGVSRATAAEEEKQDVGGGGSGRSKFSQRPEDFMDDEDFGSFGFAPHALKTKARFQNNSSQETTRSNRPEGTLFGAVINQLIQPTLPTIGESLLRAQGWKPGHGIGPKTSKRSKKDRKSSHKNTYGEGSSASIRGGKERRGYAADSSDDSGEEEMMKKYKEFMFAPDELPVYMADPKDNFFGIGYKGLERPGTGSRASGPGSGAFSVKSAAAAGKKKFSISGEAFGVGVYEEDDFDVYNNARDDMAQYDFSLDVGEVNSKKFKALTNSNSKMLDELTDVLDGFTLSTRRSMLIKSFPPPRIPREWRPSEAGYVKKSRFDDAPSRSEATKPTTSNPTRDQRRSTLFPDDQNKSVGHSREKSSKPAPRDKSADIKEEEVKREPEELPDFLTSGGGQPVASTSGGFRPFQADPAKQLRYEQFLVCIKNNRRDALRILQPKSMTEWERERERVEFERAAHLYKPMNVAIASRFVSSGTIKEDGSLQESVGDSGVKSEDGAGAAGIENTAVISFVSAAGSSKGDVSADKRKAVDMKMFGKLTRETQEWVPAKLLCVRFNVKNPFNNTREHEDKKKKPIFESNQLFAFLGSARQASDNKTSDNNKDDIKEEKAGNGDDDSSLPRQVKQERIDPRDVVLVKDEPEIQAPEKPPMDLFKAIFADSSDDDGSQSEGEQGEDNTNNLSLLADNTMKRSRGDDGNGSGGSSRHDSPANGGRGPNSDAARGIFAGINFDKFEKRRRKTPPPVVPLKALTSRPKSILDRSVRNILGIKSGDVSDDEYGPVAPPTVLAANAAAQSIRSKTTASPLRRKEENAGKSIVISSDDSGSSDSEKEWQEKEKGREKGKKKKKGKDKEKEKHKKEKKSKKKRKKKKHKSSKSDSD